MKKYEYTIERHVLEDSANIKVISPRVAYDYAMEHLYNGGKALGREAAWALMLNKGACVTGHFLVGLGGTDSAPIDIKPVAKAALDTMAEGVILIHNHPSNNPEPSQADLKQTGKLKKALDLFGISLLDHVIVVEGGFFSFSDERRTEI